MKRTRNLLALLLAALMVSAPLTACSDGDPADTTGSADTTVSADTTTVEPEETRIPSGLPETMNLDGYTITFYGKEVSGIYAEEETGDIVNDAIYRRNGDLTEQHNFKIEFIAGANQEKPITECMANIQAGDDAYKVLIDGGNRYIAYIQAGLLQDMNSMKYQDYTQPWWFKDLNDGMTIRGKLYMSTGAFMLTSREQAYHPIINKQLAEDNNIDVSALYQLVRDGKWTIDEFAKLTKIGSKDLNGDGKMDHTDQWAVQFQAYCGYSLALGAGYRIADIDTTGTPVITAGTAEAIDIWDKLTNSVFVDTNNFLATQNISGVESTWTAASSMWNEGRVLMVFNGLGAGYRELEFDYAVLPAPKMNEAQENYYHSGSSWNSPLVGVPVTVADVDKVSFILEAMAYTSYYDVLPSFYENYLETKLVRDRDSVEMLQIIQSSLFYDPGAVFGWGGYISALYNIVTKATNNLATIDASNHAKAETQIQQLLEQIEKNAVQ